MKDLKSFVQVWNKINYVLSPSQKRWGVVVFFVSLIGSIIEMLGVSIILPLVQVMLQPQQLFANEYVAYFCNKLGVYTERDLLILVTLCVIFVYILKNAFLTLQSYIRIKYAMKIQRELSVRMLQSYMRRDYNYFRITNISILMRGTSGAVSGLQDVVYQFFKVLAEILTILFIFAYIAITDWKMVIVMIILAAVCLLMVLVVFRKIMQTSGKKYYDNVALANQWLHQLFTGIKEVLVMRKKDYFVKNYEMAYIKQQKESVIRTVASESPAYAIEAICVTGIIVAVCVRVLGMTNPAEYVAQLAAFAMAAFRILPSLGRISSSINGIVFQLPAVDEAYENMLEAEKFAENDKQDVLSIDCERSEDYQEEKEILKISNVAYSYPDGDKKIINDISLSISKGEAIALVGASGAGKSMMADIILGLFVPQSGQVYYKGKTIGNLEDSDSNIIGYVPQSIYMLNDTIRRNVAFGVDDEMIDDELVWHVLELAQMKEYISNLPDGLDTLMGERGMRFSGGQAQRLAIARALYTKPEVLVLDEATSALDNDTEKTVMEAVEALHGKMTLVIIAHRLSTVKQCDRIYEIADGKAVLRSYEELVKENNVERDN